MTPLLEARNVGKTYGGGFLRRQQTVALQSASLTIEEETPTIIAVAGESGSGKTTLARLLLGMTPPTTGQILYKGHDLRQHDQAQGRIFRREVQAVFQDPFEVYNPFYKVDHALTTPIGKFFPGTSTAQSRRMIDDALHAVGLRPEETLGRYPHQLSEHILMMYGGNVVEAGDVDLVIKAPQHPYTQLLIDSIPLPNPKLQWGQREVKPRQRSGQEVAAGCSFADRCPQVMDVCRTQTPPFIQTEGRRTVACYLYEDESPNAYQV